MDSRVILAGMTALSKWSVLDQLSWCPHAAQDKVISSPARNRVVCAGRRTGKSEIGGHELIPEAFFTNLVKESLSINTRREFWIVGPEYSDSEKEFRVLWNELTALQMPFDKPGSYNNPEQGDMHLSLWDGKFQVHAKSAKYPDQLTGEGLHGVIMAEAAKMKESVWTKYIRPMLSDYDGWSLFNSTPEGNNWFRDLYFRGKDPANPEWASWRFPSWINPFVYKTYTKSADVRTLQRLLKETKNTKTLYDIRDQFNLIVDDEVISVMNDLTQETFNQEVAALFTDFVGKVFKTFDEDIHVRPVQYTTDLSWDTVACMDQGFTNPNVWLLIQIGPFGEINILDEVYRVNLTAIEFAEEIKARGLDKARIFYPDPASPGDNVQISDELRIPIGGGTGGDLNVRLDMVRAALKPILHHVPVDHPDNRPRLVVSPKCTETIREFQAYRYPERKGESADLNADEKPMKKDDHTMEAITRFFAGHFGTLPNDKGASWQARAAMQR